MAIRWCFSHNFRFPTLFFLGGHMGDISHMPLTCPQIWNWQYCQSACYTCSRWCLNHPFRKVNSSEMFRANPTGQKFLRSQDLWPLVRMWSLKEASPWKTPAEQRRTIDPPWCGHGDGAGDDFFCRDFIGITYIYYIHNMVQYIIKWLYSYKFSNLVKYCQ